MLFVILIYTVGLRRYEGRQVWVQSHLLSPQQFAGSNHDDDDHDNDNHNNVHLHHTFVDDHAKRSATGHSAAI